MQSSCTSHSAALLFHCIEIASAIFHCICGRGRGSIPYDFIICFQSALWADPSHPCALPPAARTPRFGANFVWFRFRMLFVVESRWFLRGIVLLRNHCLWSSIKLQLSHRSPFIVFTYHIYVHGRNYALFYINSPKAESNIRLTMWFGELCFLLVYGKTVSHENLK